MQNFHNIPNSGQANPNDFYYRFPNSGVAYKIAHQAGFLVSGANGYSLVKFTPNYALDLIGPVVTGYATGATGLITPLVNQQYHLNLRILNDTFQAPSGAAPYLINAPKNPVRRFL